MTQSERITNLENQVAYLKGQIAVLMALRTQPYTTPIKPYTDPFPYQIWCDSTSTSTSSDSYNIYS